MKIQITKDCPIERKVHTVGATVDVPDELAERLIAAGYATKPSKVETAAAPRPKGRAVSKRGKAGGKK